MSKPSSKFGQFLARLKGKASGLFKKKAPREEEYEYVDEYEYEDEEGYEEDGEYEDDFEDDDQEFEQLTVTDIKANQGEPPDLPLDDFDDEDYLVEDEPIETTNPSFREFGGNGGKGKRSFNLPNFALLFSKLNTDGFFEALYSPQNRPRVHRSFLLFLTIGSSYLTGRILTDFLTPPPAKKTAIKKGSNYRIDPTRNLIADMRRNDLFQAPDKSNTPIRKKDDKPDFKEVKICKEASKKSSLSLKLVNTIVLQDEVKSLASVQIRGKENYLRVGDQIPNMIEVGSINGEKIIFKNLRNRQCEFIENDGKGKAKKLKPLNIVREPKKARAILQDGKDSGITNVGNVYKIKKEVRSQMLENISEVLTQAKAVKLSNPDGSLSFKMTEVVPGSIYSKLNIQDNDIIDSINGKKITNMNDLMNYFGQIDKLDHFEIGLRRDGIEQNLEYNFE